MEPLQGSGAKPQRTTVFWIVVSVLFFSFSWLSSAFAGYGSWKFGAAGIEFWWIWDPGAAYLSNGLNLFEYNVRDLGYIGHPGLPLILMIAFISRLYYWISGASIHSIPYSQFAAKHLQSIILFSRLAVTGFHLLSFYVLFRFSVGLLKSRRASMIAVLGYATSLFVLIFVNDISSEPFLLIFTLLALIWSRRIPELLSRGLKREAYLRAALAGLVSMMAFYTKFMLAAPLLMFIPVFILGAGPYLDHGRWESLKSRMSTALVFSSVALVLFALGTVLVNWKHVVRGWMEWAPGNPQLTTGGTLANAWHLLVVSIPALVSTIFKFRPSLPSFSSQQGIFIILESGFLLLCISGLAIYWRAHKPERAYLKWLIGLLLLFVPVLTHRPVWHYLVIHLAIGAVFFGYLVDKLSLKVTKRYPIFSNSFAVAVCLVLLIHGASIALAVMIKWSDIVNARQWTPYFTALQGVSYDGHIGLIGNTDLDLVSGTVTAVGSGTPLEHAFRQFFVSIDRGTGSESLAAQKIQIIVEKDQDGNIKVRPIH